MKHIMILLLFLTSFRAFAMTSEEKANFELIKQAAEQTNPDDLKLMNEIVKRAATAQTEMYKMSGKSKTSTFLTCTVAKAGAGVKIEKGICLDSNGRFHQLSGPGFGVILGAQASFFLGVVRSYDNEVAGTYENLEIGSAIMRGGSLLRQLSSFGPDVIYASTGDLSRSLVLVGIAIGPMFDLTTVGLVELK